MGVGLAAAQNTNNWYPALVGKNTSFSLDDHYNAFIDGEVAAGRYRSASDVVRSALRLLEDRETQLRALRAALVAGERSGTSTPFDFDAFLGRKRAEELRGR
jgi:antitoxin ParD1/3/4